MTNIKTLLGERILVLPCVDEEKTKSGIILSGNSTAQNKNLLRAIVVKRGTAILKDNPCGIMDRSPVLYRRGCGTPHEEPNEHGEMISYLILKRDEILFVE